MNDKLTLNNLEKLMEMETQLRGEYQPKLDEKDAAISKLADSKTALETRISELEKTIATQLTTITELSGKSKDARHWSNVTVSCTTVQRI